ncbi:hypothetical protein [Cribrihabitans pelagius]|uniref:hypothetical protein n=1 Tax=Cribrihabitans pelagius TaxID=1765746 RepID=UPI003B5B05C6
MSQIQIRFEVPNHYMSVNAFVASAKSAQRALNTLNRELFDDQLDLELVVFAPEPGSVRQILKVVVKGARATAWGVAGTYGILWTVVQGLETDIAKEVVKELTGKLPAQIAADVVSDFRERIEQANTEKEREELEKAATEQACKEIAEVMSQASSSALVVPRERLERLPVSEKTIFELSDAQAEMFEGCIADPAISSVEIENNGHPPIPRHEFPRRAIRPKRPDPERDENEEWRVSLEAITVTSPNLEEEDQQARQWKGKTANDKKALFTVEDREFWDRLHQKELSFSENTEIVAQVATRFLDGRAKQSKVLRVLKFEGREIAQPIDENGLKAILGELKSVTTDDGFGHLLG